MNAEQQRIAEMTGTPETWRHWGPYLAERAWGTVREDYSTDGDAWNFFPHDHARSRAYRWNEDGLGGISDIRQFLCFAVALWNGQDRILKERLYGLSNPEGNHGEDVKECYYYLDATPSHSYLKFLYKYPQAAFPYQDLIDENKRRGRGGFEYEIQDTGVFDGGRYFDVFVEYAKESPDDIAILITAWNRGPETAPLHILPTLWFRNTWSWGSDERRPSLRREGDSSIRASHFVLGTHYLHLEMDAETVTPPDILFTENETNFARLFGSVNASRFVKDAFHNRVINGDMNAVSRNSAGTKAAAWFQFDIPAGECRTVRLRLRADGSGPLDDLFNKAKFDDLFTRRRQEADEFYEQFTHPLDQPQLSDDARNVQRQAYAGLIWSKQYYHYDVQKWLDGDPAMPPPPKARQKGRNSTWQTASMRDVLSMPDKWEYPWFAAWDLAFHMIPFAQIDPDFAKNQLILMCREWYMHPNGQLPAYEWNFSDVNPPVHAWAALRVYRIEKRLNGIPRNKPGDTTFLQRIFHKLLLNFTWWVNRKDVQGNNIFEGGFLGLDNIGVFDRSAPLPGGGYLEQCDGTAWMGMFCLNMLAIALELAHVEPAYQDVAVKFAEHFVYIAHALSHIGPDDTNSLWDDRDGFYYDVLHRPANADRPQDDYLPLRIRSMVGLIPLFAVEAFDSDALSAAPDFLNRMDWFLRNKPNLSRDVAHITKRRQNERVLFSLVGRDRLQRILRIAFDESEFLSPHGLRALSKYHEHHPYNLTLDGQTYFVDYEPAESTSGMFGGNSNWRGPVWFPLNYLLVEALQKYDYAFGSDFTMEFPTGSGEQYDLWHIAGMLSRRLSSLFLRDAEGRRPAYGGGELFQNDPHFRDLVLFYEYFHGDNGAGLGANHQTGWTALVAKLLSQNGA